MGGTCIVYLRTNKERKVAEAERAVGNEMSHRGEIVYFVDHYKALKYKYAE